MTIDNKDKPLFEKLLSNPEISNAIDELAIDDLFSKMFGSNNTLNIELSTMMKLYEELLQLIVDDVGGQYFIDNIKSNNKRVSLSSLSFDSPIVIRDDRFEFIFRFCEFNKGVTFDCETMNLSTLDMSIVYGNLVLTDKCKLIYNKALNISSKSVCDIYIPKSVKRITAIDSYVRKIENDSIEVDLRPYECENMEFEDNSFDVVVSTFCLCSVTDVNKTLQEVRRVLRNNGRLLLLEHGKAHNRFLQYVQKATNPFFNCLACGCNVNRDYFQQMREMGFVMQEESIRRCKIQPSLIAGHLYRAVAIVKKGDDEWKN